MKVFSTFTGIGGFELGIQDAYRSSHRRSKKDSTRNQRQGLLAEERQEASAQERPSSERDNNIFNERPLFVGYSEIDRYACSVYERHFPGVKNYGDITTIDARELPDFDLLVGGFPCQAFSIAGKRKGFEDTRGTLFFDLARILEAKQPKYFIFENVKGLLSHDNGQTFKTIIAATSELGYDCQWQVLNSKDFGVPQNRERVFIVGHFRRQSRPKIFPIERTNSQAIRELTSGVRETKRIYSEDGLSPTLNTQDQHGVFDGIQVRRLTPLECERLQGFPDGFTEYGLITDNFISYNVSGNIILCKKSKLKNTKNVQLKTVNDNAKQILAIALCTTSDGKDMEALTKSYEEIIHGDLVNIVINQSENLELMDCVVNIIKCDGFMETHSIWREKEATQAVADILEDVTVNLSIEQLSKSLSGENCDQTKLSITSIAIKQIIDWIISTLRTNQTTRISIKLSPNISQKGVTFQIYNLMEQHIQKMSDSARYKMCGNAVTTNVVAEIFGQLIS